MQLLVVAAVAMLGPALGVAQDGPIRLANIADGSAAAQPWRNGLELALREINARGGILGRQVVLSHVATPEAALAAQPYLLLAPQPLSRPAPLPVISADRLLGDAAGHGELLAGYVAARLTARRVALIVTDDPAHRALGEGAARAFAAQRVAVAAEIAAEPGQVDFSAVVLRARNAAPDALVVLVEAAAAPRLLAELHRQNHDGLVVGAGALAAAAAAAQPLRVQAIVGLDTAAPLPPIRDMVRSYAHAYGSRPEAASLAGYSAAYVIKAISERAGGIDADAFARTLKGATLLAAEHPGVLIDIRFDELGYGHRGAALVALRDGLPAVVDLLPP